MSKSPRKLNTASKYILSLGAVAAFFSVALGAKNSDKMQVIEAQKIILKNAQGGGSIELSVVGEFPTIALFDEKGQPQMQMQGGSAPKIVVYNNDNSSLNLSSQEGIRLTKDQNKVVFEIARNKDSSAKIALGDQMGTSRVEMQSGPSPAVFIKNENKEVICALMSLVDGGAALGLADKEGDVAAFMRGGAQPSLSFFNKSNEPFVALGMSKELPHFMMYSAHTKDHIVFHGGDPTSILFVNEKGEVPILLSKQGLFQGKSEEEKEELQPDQNKIFTWEELKDPLVDTYFPKR